MTDRKRAMSKPFFVLAALSLAAIVGLCFFRSNASHLEYRLSNIEKSIERCSVEEEELRRELSSLTSTIRIYSYCKERLGMSTARSEIVRMPSVLVADVIPVEPQKAWRSSLFSFFGFTVN